jgi:hypothetical protein
MRIDGFVYRVEAEVEMDVTEATTLMNLALGHYDRRCQKAGEHGGFIYGWRNALMSFKTPVRVTWEQFDTVAKILENQSSPTELVSKWCEMFNALREEQKKVRVG